MQLGLGDAHSLLLSDEADNAWYCIFIFPYIFLVWHLITHKGNFSLTWYVSFVNEIMNLRLFNVQKGLQITLQSYWLSKSENLAISTEF
jgi:hypothetical protein